MTPARSRSARALALALSLVSGACTCGKAPQAAPQPAPAAAAPGAPQPTAAAQQPAAPATIGLEIATDPAGAEIRLDGEVVGTSPLHLKRPHSTGQHKLTATLAGYRPADRDLTFEATQIFTIELTRIPQAHAAAAIAPAAAKPAVDHPAEDTNYRIDDLKNPYGN